LAFRLCELAKGFKFLRSQAIFFQPVEESLRLPVL
jgi:hypothetical protein